MTVIDSGRETPYDFSHQYVTFACTYDVVWRGLKVMLPTGTFNGLLHSVATCRSYIDAAPHNAERLFRVIRVRGWVNAFVYARLTPNMGELIDGYRTEISIEWRAVRKIHDPNELVWDWDYVRHGLRRMFQTHPHLFVDIRKGVKANIYRGIREERNYFIWLCDEETYVRHKH